MDGSVSCIGLDNWLGFIQPYKRVSAVYSIHCIENEKFYIGQTVNLYSRLCRHCYTLGKKIHKNRKLQADYIKFGDNFFMLTIQKTNIDINLLRNYEKFFLNKYLSIYTEKKCYNKISRTFDKDIPLDIDEDRFWAKFNISDTDKCWVPNKKIKSEYHKITHNHETYRSHRVAFTLNMRKDKPDYQIPNEFLVRHLCHNKSCVNPSHLVLGTDKENAQDSIKFGNFSEMILKSEEVDFLRSINKKLGEISSVHRRYFGKKFGVNEGTIYHILKNLSWYDEAYIVPSAEYKLFCTLRRYKSEKFSVTIRFSTGGIVKVVKYIKRDTLKKCMDYIANIYREIKNMYNIDVVRLSLKGL